MRWGGGRGGGGYTTFVRPTPVINSLLKDLQLKEFTLEAEYEEESSSLAPGFWISVGVSGCFKFNGSWTDVNGLNGPCLDKEKTYK